MERRLLGHEQGAMYHLKHILANVSEIAEEIHDDASGHHHKHKHRHHHEHEAHGKYVHREHKQTHRDHKHDHEHKDSSRSSAGLTFH